MINAIDTIRITQIISNQKAVGYNQDGQPVDLNITIEQQSDQLFWASLKDIIKAQLWVPLLTTTNQLLTNDWLNEDLLYSN